MKGQGKVKATSNKSQGKVKVRSRQRKHNLNLNYNLMGFDTIEINLVVIYFWKNFEILLIVLKLHQLKLCFTNQLPHLVLQHSVQVVVLNILQVNFSWRVLVLYPQHVQQLRHREGGHGHGHADTANLGEH